MKPRKPEGNYMTEEDLLQRLPSLLQQYGLSVSGSAPGGASMSQHTPSVPPHYEQRSSKASTNFVDVAGVTEVAPCYLRISDLADYIVAHGSVFPRAPGDIVHGVPLLPHQVKVSVTLVLPGMGEYTIPCPTEHMETVADCEGSFVAWPKSLVGVGDPPVQTARHGDFSSSKSRPILGVRPTAPSSPVQDVVDRSSYVAFGPRCRELCQWLTCTSALPTISVILNPESMLYPEETELRMRSENIRLGGYFGNNICLSLRLDRIGLMFLEYPNKKGTLSVVSIQCDFVGSSLICVQNVQYRYPRYFIPLCLILDPS
ncbi:unnamed protein product [Cuscuta campestris]|uniref:DUF8039 domain-containing protein n=1 Tax=Cuscuta campestris TaxID=132261 RepID=A0A484KMT7_9ASTE|nr:unnamed protein product [Cuscuta campestris]